MKSDLKFVRKFEKIGGDGLTLEETDKILKANRFPTIN